MKKRISFVCMALCVLMTSAMTCSTSAIAEETTSDIAEETATEAQVTIADGYTLVSASGTKSLYFNYETAALYINDSDTGCQWRSTPLDYDADEALKESIKMNYDSQLILEYADQSGNIYELSSKYYSVKKDGLSVEKIDGGVRAVYTFPKCSVVIPVDYVLDGDKFTATVELDGIKENDEKYTLIGWSLLPYFNAGGKQDDGFMLVPDGSGAIINFNNGKSSYQAYSQYVYGRDTSINVTAASENYENAMLPVFGTSLTSGSSIAVITSGESRCIINAQVTGTNAAFNSAYSEFIYRDSTMASFNDKSWNKKEVRVFEKSLPSLDKCSVSYFLLNGDTTYANMALRYQNYLTDSNVLTKQVKTDYYPMYVELYGSINAVKHILGFPINSEVALTKYSDALDILKELKSGNVNDIVLKYDNWNKGGPESSTPVNASISSALGGKSNFNILTLYMEQNDIQSFFDINVTDMYKSRYGFIKTMDSAKMLNQSPTIQYQYSLSTLQKEETEAFWYLLNPLKIKKASSKIANAISKYTINGISTDTLCHELYSSYNEDGMDRVSAQGLWEESLETLKEAAGNMICDEPNAYALPYADYVSALPTQSTQSAITDYDVPFYQMVLHSKIVYSMESNNKFSNFDKSILTALETGSSLNFEWIARNTDKISDTQYDTLYADDYKNWIDDAISSYNEIRPLMAKVSDSRIVSHTVIESNVRKTSYENGISVIVNYNQYDVTVDGDVIQANGYYVIGE